MLGYGTFAEVTFAQGPSEADAGELSLAAAAGSFSLTGTAAALKLSRKVVGGAGSYAITGQTANLRHGYKIVGGAGSYALTGTAASLLHGYRPVAGAGTYALTGTAAVPKHGWRVAAEAGSYALTGTAATLRAARKVDAGSGTYALTGTDATLTKTGAFSLVAGEGVYALSGTDASLLAAYRVVAGTAAFALTGAAAILTKSEATVSPPLQGGGATGQNVGGPRSGSRGSPGGGGDQDWHKRLRDEIERLLADDDPDARDIAAVAREVERQEDGPQPIVDVARQIAVSEAVEATQSMAMMLENLALLDQWLVELAAMNEQSRLAATEAETEEILLLYAASH
jgi:hypothetical protein